MVSYRPFGRLVSVVLSLSFLCAVSFAAAPSDLMNAVRAGDVSTVTTLLAADPGLAGSTDATGATALHYAAAAGRADLVALLLGAGADANATDPQQRTPLHAAAMANNARAVDLLRAAGAELEARDWRGDTPLHLAARRANGAVLEALLVAGANPAATNDAGQTPLHLLGAEHRDPTAARAELHTLAEVLIAYGADAEVIANGLPALQPPTQSELPTRDTWVAYSDIGPTLLAYETQYPNLCKRYDIGLSVQGRHLWALRISDNMPLEEDEPEFKYISTMHGDEIIGVKMCMLLIDDLLTQYGTDPQITNIVNEVDLWILPLMNPDGYDRTSRTRENADGVDLNRSFPDYGDANATTGRPIEVADIMNWTAANAFVCSANFHGGALVVNYPFDNDYSGSVYSPDDDLFQYISLEYATRNLPMYNGSFYHGITNGAEWYYVDGGMQDWNYHFEGCNEVTIELGTKEPSASLIGTYWSDNRDAMLAYIDTCMLGVRGIVTDAGSDAPLAANVTVIGRNHTVHTDPDVGDYHRMLLPGTYQVRFDADGYESVTLPVTVTSGSATRLDVALELDAHTAVLDAPLGGETLTAGVPTAILWHGNTTSQFQVQYTDNYGAGAVQTDDFESGMLDPAFVMGGTLPWTVTTADVHGGTYAARAGAITHKQTSTMTRTVGGGDISFWYRVSSESRYDFFNFYIDGVEEISVSGNGTWTYYANTLATGLHELTWEYTKDITQSYYDDTVYIDDVALTADLTAWNDVSTLTTPGTMSVDWTPQTPGTDYKVRVRAYSDGTYGDWSTSPATFTVEASPLQPGDVNCDGNVDFFDIDPFVLALTGQQAYEATYPNCNYMNADSNGDGNVDFFDIDPFVVLLTQ